MIKWKQTILRGHMAIDCFPWSNKNRRISWANDKRRLFHGHMARNCFAWSDDSRRIFHGQMTTDCFPRSHDNRLSSMIKWEWAIFYDQMTTDYSPWAHDNRFFHGYMTEDYFSWLHNNRRIFHDHVTNAFSMVTLVETGTQVGKSQWLVAALQRPRSNIRHSSLQQWDNSYSSDRNRQILTSLSVGQSLESGENRAC